MDRIIYVQDLLSADFNVRQVFNFGPRFFKFTKSKFTNRHLHSPNIINWCQTVKCKNHQSVYRARGALRGPPYPANYVRSLKKYRPENTPILNFLHIDSAVAPFTE